MPRSRLLYLSFFVLVSLAISSNLFVASQNAHASTWYNSSWVYRKSITIDHSKVSTASSTTLTDFPVLVSVTDPDLRSAINGGDVGSTTGADILFTDSDGTTKLDHEIESYDPTTGTLVAWVKVPSLSPSADHTLDIYFGNPSAADQENVAGTWSNGYAGVWHLDKDVTTNPPDSTNSGNTGTSTNVTATAGMIGGAGSFNGSSSVIAITNNTSLNPSQFTVEGWADETGTNGGIFLGSGDASAPSMGYWLAADGTNSWLFNVFPGGSGGLSAPLATSTWTDEVGTYDGNTSVFYLDGTETENATDTYSSYSSTHVVTIGASDRYGDITSYFPGALDEIRVSNVARSPDWISTEYNNESSPLTFLTEGSLESSPSAPSISFSANPTTIAAGHGATLSWGVIGTTTSMSITPGPFYPTSTSGSLGVNPSSTTVYTFIAANSNGTSTATTSVIVQQLDTTAPTVPSNLAVAAGTTTISLSWSPSIDPLVTGDYTSNLSGYDIYRDGSHIATTTSAAFTDTGLLPGTAHT
ncbi:MAG: DUF2341 domain-containing protein, partial [Candidatus Micrarchaeaceae archaeon]